jgi:hypothetical protein
MMAKAEEDGGSGEDGDAIPKPKGFSTRRMRGRSIGPSKGDSSSS